MSRVFDIIIIGTGVAGNKVALRMAQRRKRVAIVDDRPFGGTCTLRGCNPKKVLTLAAASVDWSRRMEGRGLHVGDVGIHWTELHSRMETFVKEVPKAVERDYEMMGIEAFHGRASFLSEDRIQVNDVELEADHFVIASGAMARKLNIAGEDLLTTSDGFLELEELPPRIVFVGGGYISFEFAQVAAMAGSSVSIVHRSPIPLKGFDPDLVKMLVQTSEEMGIEVILNTEVTGLRKSGDNLLVVAKGVEGEMELDCEMAVHGAGRAPNTAYLNLGRAKVRTERDFVDVNEFMQSVSNSRVYAAGDATLKGPPLTPSAELQADVVVHNILHGNERKADLRGIPSVVFTSPPLASVGMNEMQARSIGMEFGVKAGDTSAWDTTRRAALGHSGFKVLVESKGNTILGAHLFGFHAEEVINLFALAIRERISVDRIREMPFAFPTSSHDIRRMV